MTDDITDAAATLIGYAAAVKTATKLGYPHMARQRAAELVEAATAFQIALSPALAERTEAEELAQRTRDYE